MRLPRGEQLLLRGVLPLHSAVKWVGEHVYPLRHRLRLLRHGAADILPFRRGCTVWI